MNLVIKRYCLTVDASGSNQIHFILIIIVIILLLLFVDEAAWGLRLLDDWATYLPDMKLMVCLCFILQYHIFFYQLIIAHHSSSSSNFYRLNRTSRLFNIRGLVVYYKIYLSSHHTTYYLISSHITSHREDRNLFFC